MVDIQTDSRTITVEIREHANLVIQNLDVPSFSYMGNDFVIEYDVLNQGGEELCYCKVLDEDGNQLDRWENTIVSGDTQHIQHTINIPNAGNITLVIDVGYVN